MKILTLHFQNLNSLKGEWFIDFRDPAYANEGIFAITGATGAGKSTILDAICLALYGATPRLGDITQAKNDLMSRHTGECSAEVVFSTQAGTFRCSWGQKRAHKKPDGKLQSPKHEISTFVDDGIDGELLEEKAQRTKLKVESITGMDFSRFTRAMLLAQGSFSAFLQASSDERSPILEQITGTEIYSEISKKVHEIKRAQETELATLKAQLSGLNVLAPEQEQALTLEQQQLADTLAQCKATITDIEFARHWRSTLDGYLQQQQQLHEQQAQLTERIGQFAPQQQRLARAQKAEQLKADYQKLLDLRAQQDQQAQQLAELKAKQPVLQQAYQAASAEKVTHHTAYQSLEADWHHKVPLFNRVRELDIRLAQLQVQQQQLNDQLHGCQAKQAHNVLQRQQTQQVMDEHQRELTDLTAKQQQQAHGATLPQTLASLQPMTEEFSRLHTQLAQLDTRIAALTTEQTTCQQQSNKFIEARQAINTQLASHQQTQQTLESELAHISQGHSLNDLQQNAQRYWQQQTQLHTMLDWQQQLWHNTNKQQHAQAQIKALTQTLEQQHQQQTHGQALLVELNAHIHTLEQHVLLLSKIQDLEAERKHLVEGAPCPLCGATTHPYADPKAGHTPAQLDHAQVTLNNARQQLRDQQTAQQDVLIRINNTQKDLTQLNEQQQQLTTDNQRLTEHLHKAAQTIQAQALNDIIDELREAVMADTDIPSTKVTNAARRPTVESVARLAQDLSQALAHCQAHTTEQADALATRLAKLNQLQDALAHSQQQGRQLTDQDHQLHQDQLACHGQLQQIAQRLSDFGLQRSTALTRQTQLGEQLTALVAPFDTQVSLPSMTPQALGQAIATLQTQARSYQGLTDQITQLTDKLQQAQQTLTTLIHAEQHLAEQQQQLHTQLAQVQSAYHEQQQQRHACFGTANPDDGEKTLYAQKQTAFEQWQTAQQAATDLNKQLEILHSQIEQLTNSQCQLNDQLATAEPTLYQQFERLGFVDEQDYRQACLPMAEREQLQSQAELLSQQRHLIQDKLTTLTEQIGQAKQQITSPLSQDVLSAQLQEQQTLFNQHQRALGAIDQQLRSNAERKQQQQGLLSQVAAQHHTLSDWQQLHELIGSSDGKKFRNFAQGLTFNIMINHANEQLKKMSDRYLLLADGDNPLILNVMDNYQGGQIRTSKNLSGGESFIISLALALGLSNMASHRMQVDSLFLDEGFGTLDEEALDIALDTLTNLQQGGKLIGVISHIQALKDRIPSQIRVIPQTGGVSKIVGEGVRQVTRTA